MHSTKIKIQTKAQVSIQPLFRWNLEYAEDKIIGALTFQYNRCFGGITPSKLRAT